MPDPINYISIEEYDHLKVGTDWSPALDAAIVAATAVGKCVLIPTGTYRIENVVSLLSHTTIIGEHKTKSILQSDKFTGGHHNTLKGSTKIFDGLNLTDICLRNLTLDGDAETETIGAGTLPNANTTLLYLDGCSDITISDVAIKNFATIWDTSPTNQADHIWSSLHIYDCDKVRLTNVSQNYCRVEGVQLINCKNSKVEGFISRNNEGIWTPLHIRSIGSSSDSFNNCFINSSVDGSGGSLININGERIRMENLDLTSAGNGFLDLGPEGMDDSGDKKSKEITIQNLSVRDVKLTNTTTQGPGIYFLGEGLSVSGVQGSGIEIGILLEEAESVSISNVIFKDLVDKRLNAGIDPTGIVAKNSRDVTISGALIQSSPGYGLIIKDSEGLVLTNSMIKSCETNPIIIQQCTNLTIISCTLDNSGLTSFSRHLLSDQYSTVADCQEVTITSCHLTGTTNNYGISLDRSFNTSCFGNSGDAAELYETHHSNKAIISSGGNNLNYRTPLSWGSYTLWMDSSGVLRKKNGSPNSDSDGTSV